MAKFKSADLSEKIFKKKRKQIIPGAAPGSLLIADDALTPRIEMASYQGEVIQKKTQVSIVDALNSVLVHPEQTHWVDIRGFGDSQIFDSLSQTMDIHNLALEDVINVHQRPKMEDFDSHIFFISRMLYLKDESLVNEQLSLFVGKNYVITIQENYDDVFDPVRTRLENGKGHLRTGGPSYLAYALMDTVIDNYYPILENLGDRLDELEDRLILRSSRHDLEVLQDTKRELITMRRAIWPERDKINEVLRSTSSLFTEKSKLFFRDSYDHSIQVLDLVENYKELTASLMDVYLSSLSNRMNQIMKVLAIISTIFIPLTFIAGIYGMNFASADPTTGEPLPSNMPELYSPHGYTIVVTLMCVMVLLQLYIFYKKGWLGKD